MGGSQPASRLRSSPWPSRSAWCGRPSCYWACIQPAHHSRAHTHTHAHTTHKHTHTHTHTQVRAAIMFQGLYRAHKCRRWIARRRAALNLARCIRMANRVQRTFRGYRGRVRYRVLLHLQRIDAYAVAITPIQALGRGHIVRQRMRDEAARLADIELKRLRASLMLFGQTRAARIIQKDYRRWTVRKFEWAVNHAASSIQLWYRLRRMGAQGRAARQRIYNKATKLQFVVRGHLTRNLVRELRRQVGQSPYILVPKVTEASQRVSRLPY